MFSRAPYSNDPFSGANGGTAYGCCCDGICCGCSVNSPRRQWNFTASGITNNSCAACSEFNGTFNLKWSPNTCSWLAWKSGPTTCADEAPPTEDLCENNYYWKLVYNASGGAGDGFYLTPNTGGASIPTYFLAIGSWNCAGSNVMVYDGTAGTRCATWPATITLSPSTEVIPECECYPSFDAIASEWEVVVAGITTADCADCTNINGTHILSPVGGDFCLWEKTTVTICLTFRMFMVLRIVGNGTIRVEFTDTVPLFAGQRYYARALADFNPVGSNIFTYLPSLCGGTVLTPCGGWPATITVRPRA